MQYKNAVDRLTFRPWLVCLALLTATLAVYAGSVRGTFQYDDAFTILLNPHLADRHTFVEHLDHMVRPVLYTTFLIDRALYGDSAAGYHIVNVLLHLGSGLLVYVILRHVPGQHDGSIPFWTALLFLVHPLATETVTYISGRASGLMAFGYLLTLFLYIKSTEHREDDAVRRLYVAGAIVSWLLALGSKETAITLPVALLLWDGLTGRLSRAARLKSFRAALSRHLPFGSVFVLTAAWAWSHPRYADLAHFSFQLRSIRDNLLSEAHAAAYAMGLFFLPSNQNVDHDLPVFHSLAQWPLPLDLLLFVGITAVAMIGRRPVPLLSFGIGWFAVQFVPLMLIPRADLLSERNLYLASIGLLLAVVVVGVQLTRWLASASQRPQHARLAAGSVLCAVVLALGVMTVQRNALYRDPVWLWSDAVHKSPNKARPHNNLGHAYALHDQWDLAIEEFRIASRLDPNYALAHHNLRNAYLHRVGRQD